MVIKVGINGFGRIGRVIFRACLQNPDIQLTAINDPAISVEYICYLIKFDSTHGTLKANTTHTDSEISIDDHHIKVFHEKLPSSIPWHTAGVQYIVEASGMFTNQEKASGHLASDGAKRVIITAPSVDVPMIILGVNDNTLSPDQKVISCASSTLYCLAPIIKVLEDSCGIEDGFVTSIHAMTPSLKPLDGLCLRGKHWRDHRSIHQNIIPATTGACKALGKIIPKVKDKLSGVAFRVPIVNVSVLDVTIRLKTNTTLQEIVRSIEHSSKSNMKNIIRISNEESVSSDFLGESHSCIFDLDSSIQHNPNFFKIICWYENEYSYACRVLDSIIFSEKQLLHPEVSSKMTFVRPRTSRKQEVLQQTEMNASVCNVNTKSQESGTSVKTPRHPISAKEPISPVTDASFPSYKGTKRNGTFKVWNDTNDLTRVNSRQKKYSFFQSCIAFAPQRLKQVGCNKAQERLEDVKRQFNKMVNITEEMLKKTYSNQSNSRHIDEIRSDNVVMNNVKEDISKGFSEMHKKPENKPVVDICGDCKSCVGSSINSKMIIDYSKDVMSFTSFDKEISDNSEKSSNMERESEKVNELTDYNKELIENNKSLRKIIENISNVEKFNQHSVLPTGTVDFKGQLAKTINSLIDGLSQNIQVQCVKNLRNEPLTEAKQNYKINDKCVNEILDCFYSNSHGDEIKDANSNDKPNNKTSKDITIQTKETSDENEDKVIPEVKKCKFTDKTNLKLIDEQLKKRNIMLVDSLFVAEHESHDYNEDANFTVKIDETCNDMDLQKQMEGSNRFTPETVLIVSEGTSRCVSPINTYTTLSTGFSYKQDIYDKLDSTSATDSNNSFEINERKSQVIQIKDLTNSLEDLSRLDKICRIIEISDELSDKLFSALDNAQGTELKNKRWSFKELCERIKLDEFCNKVFGTSV